HAASARAEPEAKIVHEDVSSHRRSLRGPNLFRDTAPPHQGVNLITRVIAPIINLPPPQLLFPKWLSSTLSDRPPQRVRARRAVSVGRRGRACPALEGVQEGRDVPEADAQRDGFDGEVRTRQQRGHELPHHFVANQSERCRLLLEPGSEGPITDVQLA